MDTTHASSTGWPRRRHGSRGGIRRGLMSLLACGVLMGVWAMPCRAAEPVQGDTPFELVRDGRPVATIVVPDDPLSREYTGLLGVVREIAEYAANRGCCFATETGPESAEVLADFLTRVNSGGARGNYDPANLVMCGFNHQLGLYALRGFIVHTHAKDGIARAIVENKEVQEVPLGKGDGDFPRYLHILREELGYSGYLTIERECGADPVADIAEAIAFLKRQPGVAK